MLWSMYSDYTPTVFFPINLEKFVIKVLKHFFLRVFEFSFYPIQVVFYSFFSFHLLVFLGFSKEKIIITNQHVRFRLIIRVEQICSPWF